MILVLFITVLSLVLKINGNNLTFNCESSDLDITSKFYTLLDNKFNAKVYSTTKRMGVSGTMQIHDAIIYGNVNIIENTLTLSNGRMVNYEDNKCTHSKKPRVNFNCHDQGEYEKTYYAGPVNEVTFKNGRKIITFSKRNSQYAFKLVQEYERCGRKIWTTKNEDILAFEHFDAEECAEHQDLNLYESTSKALLAQVGCGY